jgi:hypothetical protein
LSMGKLGCCFKEEEGLFVDRAFRILYRVVLVWMERDPSCGTQTQEAFLEQGLIANSSCGAAWISNRG